MNENNTNDFEIDKLNDIKVNHWNCNSIKNKQLEFKNYLHVNKPDVVSLNEIKCCNNWANELLNISGYNLIYKCENNYSGGVALLINDKFNYTEYDMKSFKDEQIVGAVCNFNNISISFFSYYNPPKNNINIELVKNIELMHKNFLIMGDLNAKSSIYGIQKNNKNGDILEELLINHNIQVLNETNDPTFHIIRKNQENYGAMLDYFIGSSLLANIKFDYQILKTNLDSVQAVQFHSIIQIKLQIESEISAADHNEKNTSYFLYDKANWIGFKEELNSFRLNVNDDIEKMYSEINLKIKNSALNNIPKVSPKIHKRSPLPKPILNDIKIRNKFQRRYKKNKTIINRRVLYEQIEKVKINISDFKSKNWSNFISKLGNCPNSTKAYWNRINRIKNKKQPKSLPNLLINDSILETDEEKANAFSERLSDTFNDSKNVDVNFNESQEVYVNNLINSKTYINDYPNTQYSDISIFELNVTLKKLNSKTSLDLNQVSNKMLKHLPANFKLELLEFMNISIKNGILPKLSKESIITMIPKKGNSNEIKNYRPISGTSCVIKLLEKILHTRITKYLDEKNIIIKQQSGFRKCCVFYDIQAAFDKVWHNGLLFKLIKLKIPLYLIEWIKNFLTDRTFKVKIGTFTSGSQKITCSTPQGTALAPLLFSIYINDLPLFDSKINKRSLLFADDLMYMYCFSKLNSQASTQLNKQTNKLECWLNNWRLKMAPDKCVQSIFSLNKKADEKGKKGFNNEKLSIKIYDKEIKLDNNAIFLGMRFDKYLTFSNQILYLKRCCNERLNLIKVLGHKSWNLDINTKLQMYKALVRSLLDYSLFIFPVITNKNKRKLQFIQDSALRLIYKKKWDFDINILHQWANLETLEIRAKNMLTNYFNQANENNNPLISDLHSEFDHFERNFKNENIFTLIDYIQ